MVLGLPRSVCAWFSLARLPTETARKFFLDHFLKETALSFFFWLLEPVQCLGKMFLYLIFAQSRKFSKLSAILKRQREIFVMMTSIVHLSSNRS